MELWDTSWAWPWRMDNGALPPMGNLTPGGFGNVHLRKIVEPTRRKPFSGQIGLHANFENPTGQGRN